MPIFASVCRALNEAGVPFLPADLLSLPTPREPLREWTEQEIEPGVMIAAMETVMQMVQSQPDFEARAWRERAQ